MCQLIAVTLKRKIYLTINTRYKLTVLAGATGEVMKALEPTARADRRASRSIIFVCFGWYGSVVATSKDWQLIAAGRRNRWKKSCYLGGFPSQ